MHRLFNNVAGEAV